MIFVQAFNNKTEALKQEKKLKRCNKKYLLWLTEQEVNILNKKMDR
jgi:predicted GIY-YIG superfamily endonuclease